MCFRARILGSTAVLCTQSIVAFVSRESQSIEIQSRGVNRDRSRDMDSAQVEEDYLRHFWNVEELRSVTPLVR